MPSPPFPTARPASPQKPSAVSLILFGAATLAVIAAVAWLLATNQQGAKWAQGYNPTGTWQLSTAIAALPILVLLGTLAVLRVKAHIAALAGLLTALAVAILVFRPVVRPRRLPLRQAMARATAHFQFAGSSFPSSFSMT